MCVGCLVFLKRNIAEAVLAIKQKQQSISWRTVHGVTFDKQPPAYHPNKMFFDDTDSSSSQIHVKPSKSIRRLKPNAASSQVGRTRVLPVYDEPDGISEPVVSDSVANAQGVSNLQWSPQREAVEDNHLASYTCCLKCGTKHYPLLYGKPPKKLSSEELRGATGGFSNAAFREETLFNGNFDGIPVYVALRGCEEKINFFSEVNILTDLRHRNIISLRGFCEEDDSQAIVFNFICSRNLYFHLSAKSPKSMPWVSRANLAVELAKGLVYLHDDKSIIHGNVNSMNVFLNHDFVPVIGDFSLSRHTVLVRGVILQDRSEDKKARNLTMRTRESKNLKLVHTGYLAPEYKRRGTHSDKQDIYAYGVILFELISGRAAFDTRKREYLDEWSKKTIEDLEAKDKSMLVERMVDPLLRYSDYDVHTKRSLYLMIKVAKLCTEEDPRMRPPMRKVLDMLSARNGPE